ncbi:MAG: tRNA1(Val) (adenine(37)-N6)-methyltransferase [Ignavibacteria bacterium]
MRRKHQFDFKQFSVNQSHSAMKVCTDSCVFGSLIEPQNAQSIMDIGTGTGLLALMLAQRTSDTTMIDAIEIDSEAMHDAQSNIHSSPWNHRIVAHHSDIKNWVSKQPYDLILCNPPFHIHSTPSLTPKEQQAFHADDSLPFDMLVKTICNLSHEETQTWILLPIQEMLAFIEVANSHALLVQESIVIHHASNESAIRRICRFSKQKSIEYSERIFAYREYASGPYTQEFIDAMSPYYLFL